METANELLRRAYLYIVRNETIDSSVRSQAMLKLNAFPRNVRLTTRYSMSLSSLLCCTCAVRRARRTTDPPFLDTFSIFFRCGRRDRRRSRTAARRQAEVVVFYLSLDYVAYVLSILLGQMKRRTDFWTRAASLQDCGNGRQHTWCHQSFLVVFVQSCTLLPFFLLAR